MKWPRSTGKAVHDDNHVARVAYLARDERCAVVASVLVSNIAVTQRARRPVGIVCLQRRVVHLSSTSNQDFFFVDKSHSTIFFSCAKCKVHPLLLQKKTCWIAFVMGIRWSQIECPWKARVFTLSTPLRAARLFLLPMTCLLPMIPKTFLLPRTFLLPSKPLRW
jgi:hypothetical protein